MITPMQMYWLVKLDDMRCAFAGLIWLPVTWIVTTAVVSFVTFMALADEEDGRREKAVRLIKKALLLCIPMLFLAVVIQLVAAFVPSTKQMAAIIVVPKLANSEKVQTAGNKLYDLAVEWMDELRPAKGETKRAIAHGLKVMQEGGAK